MAYKAYHVALILTIMEITIQKIKLLMEETIPDLPEIDSNSLLEDLGFDNFYKTMLAQNLEQEFIISIPEVEVHHWTTVNDVAETILRYY